MKLWSHALLLLLAFAGVLNDVVADPLTYDFDAGSTSYDSLDRAYQQGGCGAVTAQFVNNPVPIGAYDVANGKEIVGYTVYCEGQPVAQGGTMGGTGSMRIIPRSFGHIRVKYAD